MEIVIANKSHTVYADIICKTIEDAAQVRGTGIAKRKPAYVATKMQNGNAVIALQNGKFAGFCYIEKWGHGKFVANSGLIVHPDFRNLGLRDFTYFEFFGNLVYYLFGHSIKFPEQESTAVDHPAHHG